jgi:hypothetical protein
MQNRKAILAIIIFFSGIIAYGQDQSIILNYINTYKDLAIAEMQRTGIPASIKLAQGIHETMAGTSELVQKSNNHFGIKCKDTWQGESVTHDDDSKGECFRKYSSAADSYRDHSDFLKGSARYASLFKLDPMNYSAWAYGLKKAGYATNPKYPQIIIKLIEDYHLQDYTLIALGKAPTHPELIAATKPGEVQPASFTAPASQVEKQKEESTPEATQQQQPTARPRPDYPSSEFKINETVVIFASHGTAFLSIAEKYNIPLARLFEFNDMGQAEIVDKDQLVFLQRKRKTGSSEFHLVQAGETLYDIAQAEGIRLESLLEYNQLSLGMQPAAGQRLYLNPKAAGRPDLARQTNN